MIVSLKSTKPTKINYNFPMNYYRYLLVVYSIRLNYSELGSK